MAYPDAYCVKCGTHTSTQQKQTVVLQNNARALKGVCPKCESNVYKILPKAKNFKTTVDRDEAYRKKYPDAFCVKCQKHTKTHNAKTVMLENGSRAMTGNCAECGSKAYRILGNKTVAVERVSNSRGQKRQQPVAQPIPISQKDRRIPMSRRAEEAAVVKHNRLANFIGIGLIIGTVAGFVAYSLF